MKVAFHFKSDDINELYDRFFYKLVFRKLTGIRHYDIISKISTGDLCMFNYEPKDKTHIFNELIQINNDTWKRIDLPNAQKLLTDNIFIICFETIQKELAQKLHDALKGTQHYIGAFEIDNSAMLQWWFYGECINPKFRIINNDFYIISESEDSSDESYLKELKDFFAKFSFKNVSIEYSEFKYSVFDQNHNYENARRLVEWKKNTESIFSTIIDDIIGRLTDAAPELSNKLWAITNTFFIAETGEQYAQAMTSCRRVFEYVADCLFPATEEIVDGHRLKKDNYRNRLIEYAKRELNSKTNLEFIVLNATSLFDEWKKLQELSNKGVHDEPHRQECRRCIIRTILLLDDLVSIRSTPFGFKTNVEIKF
jgi:hypothetical protein